ncbi:ion channel [Xanthobacter sp. V4C-4]|uniref:ion channel n=1 Tax=Xanthobacter cornucopiae TaxID=3119924 RepID=UPI003729EBEF
MQFDEILFGLLVSAITIAMQAVLTLFLMRALQRRARRRVKEHSVPVLLAVMCGTGAVLTLGHFLQGMVWALLYILVGAAPAPIAFYLALENFTTLGYGDVLPAHEWRLLGPITAANGVLMFGWSTALLYAVLNRAIQTLQLD